ncbi:MAG TPA: hypothetical protein DEP72_01800 [Clostridiales bacterium]|nr:MAG: hypothetical protein A2Y18_07715 [Clostridiales bacterium GWD2_32_19]HCC06888.1 hypothetical protein [Clostridiales bacterium]
MNNMNNNNNHGVYQTSFSGIMNKVYGIMFLGLLLTAGIAYAVSSSPTMMNLIYENMVLLIVLIVVELGLVWYLSSRVLEMSSGKAMFMFGLYSALNGITLAYIFIVYDLGAIYMAFFTTAITFGVMSVYGYFTKTDLTGIGKILFFGLIGIIIASVVNMFVGSSQVNLYISYAGVIIFLGLTAYDTQKIKEVYSQVPNENVAVLGALTLYLDFINLFLMLLRIFGMNKD